MSLAHHDQASSEAKRINKLYKKNGDVDIFINGILLDLPERIIITRPNDKLPSENNLLGVEYIGNESIKNIDPQHGYGNLNIKIGKFSQLKDKIKGRYLKGDSAIIMAYNIGEYLGKNDFKYVITRPDIDAIGSILVIEICQIGMKDYIRKDRVMLIDKGDNGKFKEMSESERLTYGAIAGVIMDRNTDMKTKLEYTLKFLTENDLGFLKEKIDEVRKENEKIAKEAKVDVIVPGKFVVVESKEKGAIKWAYGFSEVVLAKNPEFEDWKTGEKYLKYTLAQSRNVIDMAKVLEDIQKLEEGWGGNVKSGIIGSPIGKDSRLKVEDITKIVLKYINGGH